MCFYCGNIEKFLSGLCLDKDSGFREAFRVLKSKPAADLPSLMWGSPRTRTCCDQEEFGALGGLCPRDPERRRLREDIKKLAQAGFKSGSKQRVYGLEDGRAFLSGQGVIWA